MNLFGLTLDHSRVLGLGHLALKQAFTIVGRDTCFADGLVEYRIDN